jgi:hypothetical protein
VVEGIGCMGLTCRDLDCIVGRVCSLQHKNTKVYQGMHVAQLLPQTMMRWNKDWMSCSAEVLPVALHAFVCQDAFDQIKHNS